MTNGVLSAGGLEFKKASTAFLSRYGKIINMQYSDARRAVDSVSDVISLTASQIRQPPNFSSTFDVRYITGLGTVDQRMLILVDIEKLMSGADMALIEQATEQ